MGKLYTELEERLRSFIAAQRLFFVATAPSGRDGHVNCSPKGLDSLRVLDATTVAYLDYVGSGVETIAHVRENGRIVIMFCAFEGPPRIVRLHGRGEVVEQADDGFPALATMFPDTAGARSIIRIHVRRISDSCGYGVPLYRYEGERTQLKAWAERKGPEGLLQYQRENNLESIDRLPGLRTLVK